MGQSYEAATSKSSRLSITHDRYGADRPRDLTVSRVLDSPPPKPKPVPAFNFFKTGPFAPRPVAPAAAKSAFPPPPGPRGVDARDSPTFSELDLASPPKVTFAQTHVGAPSAPTLATAKRPGPVKPVEVRRVGTSEWVRFDSHKSACEAFPDLSSSVLHNILANKVAKPRFEARRVSSPKTVIDLTAESPDSSPPRSESPDSLQEAAATALSRVLATNPPKRACSPAKGALVEPPLQTKLRSP